MIKHIVTTFKRSAGKDEFERAYDKCMVYFYSFPRRTIGLSELAASIKSSKSAATKAVEILIKENFLLREIMGRSWIISANQTHRYFLTKKVPFHLSKIYESGIIEEVYKRVPQARNIILFGSYRWGKDIEESDIDIAVEIVGNEEMSIAKIGILPEIGHRKNILVNMHLFSRNKIDMNLFSNIANGIILDGFLEVRP